MAVIRRLRGRVEELGWGHAVIDVGGVGYLVFIPLSAHAVLQAAREPVVLHVHTRVREDGVELFGFVRPEELEAFELLLQVAGVGPKTALAVLSTLAPDQLMEALAEGRTEWLRRVPGVGPRLAERLCVELRAKARERLGSLSAGPPSGQAAGPEPAEANPGYADAVAALVSLGYSRAEARQAVRRAGMRLGRQASLEELIRAALGVMAADAGSPEPGSGAARGARR